MPLVSRSVAGKLLLCEGGGDLGLRPRGDVGLGESRGRLLGNEGDESVEGEGDERGGENDREGSCVAMMSDGSIQTRLQLLPVE